MLPSFIPSRSALNTVNSCCATSAISRYALNKSGALSFPLFLLLHYLPLHLLHLIMCCRPSGTLPLPSSLHIYSDTSRHARTPTARNSKYKVKWLKVGQGASLDMEAVFKGLYAEKEYCFWLNSTRVEKGLSRFSFLGSAAFSLVYNVNTRCVTVRVPSNLDGAIPFSEGIKDSEFYLGENQTFFDYLQSEVIDTRRCRRGTYYTAFSPPFPLVLQIY